jgi:two-component system cell cycle response regulator CpdR
MAKVLIVEDEPDIAKVYQKGLEAAGHRVVVTKSGEEGIKRFQRAFLNEPFDSVIMDYRLPGKNGVAAAIDILVIDPTTRIIFATAFEDELHEELKSLFGQKIPDYHTTTLLRKPISMLKLVEEVSNKDLYEKLGKLGLDVQEIKSIAPPAKRIELLRIVEDMQTIFTAEPSARKLAQV